MLTLIAGSVKSLFGRASVGPWPLLSRLSESASARARFSAWSSGKARVPDGPGGISELIEDMGQQKPGVFDRWLEFQGQLKWFDGLGE